jgi:MGT family glycosyltransferase
VIREYVPQMAVLANADLFITHGGINSAHEAMLNGVPMIVLPRSADHFVVAGQVAAAGAGIVLHRPKATAGRLIELQNAVLANPAYRHASAAVGQSLRAAGGYTRAADEILKYTHAHA